MDYVRFGKTGMKVSRLCLGCMTYGDTKWRAWTLTEEQSRPYFKDALDKGINFFDTADVYSTGESERITGKALDHAPLMRYLREKYTPLYGLARADR